MDLNAPIISNNVGTGLVPVLFVADSHGGSISVQSIPGEETVFTLRF